MDRTEATNANDRTRKGSPMKTNIASTDEKVKTGLQHKLEFRPYRNFHSTSDEAQFLIRIQRKSDGQNLGFMKTASGRNKQARLDKAIQICTHATVWDLTPMNAREVLAAHIRNEEVNEAFIGGRYVR
jgi:hypothetical protein